MMIPTGQIENWFNYHPPKNDDEVHVYEDMRERGRELAHYINQQVPDGREKSLAMTKLREAIMWANAGIACGGGS